MDANCWLEVIVAAAKKGYESIKSIIGTQAAREQIQKNELGDTTLRIDKQAEDAILNEIRKKPENVKVISEEIGEFFTQNETDEIHEYLVIDPEGSEYWGILPFGEFGWCMDYPGPGYSGYFGRSDTNSILPG